MSDHTTAQENAAELILLAGDVARSGNAESVGAQNRFMEEWASISKDPAKLNQVKQELNKFADSAATECRSVDSPGRNCPRDLEYWYGIKIDAQNHASVALPNRPEPDFITPSLR
jgi:hypothetical protein